MVSKLLWNLQAWTKLHTKMATKATERRLIKFIFLEIDEGSRPLFSYTVSNGIEPLSHCKMKLLFQTSSFSLDGYSLFLWPQRDTVSYGNALTWTLLLPVWKAFTSTRNQMYASDTSRNPLQSCLVFHSILDLLQKTSFWANFNHFMTLFYHIWLKTVSKGTWTEEVRNA